MKKLIFINSMLALALCVTIITHYACKKDAPVTGVTEQVVNQVTDDRDACNSCPGPQGSIFIKSKIYFGAHGTPALRLCGFAKDGNCPTPLCGGAGDVKGPIQVYTPYEGIDGTFPYGTCRPLCNVPLPFRFFMTNPASTAQDFRLDLSLRTSNDELCQSSVLTTIPAGATKAYIISETPNGSCAIVEQACNATE